MEVRPKVKLTLSRLDHILEITSKIVLAIMWVLMLYIFFKLPAVIPIHFGSTGQADGYGNKTTILFLPVLATVIYFGMTQLNKRPHILNYPVKITVNNALRQYTLATRMLRFIKVAVLIILSLIILFTYLTTIGVANGLGSWFLPFALGILLLPTIVLISLSLMKGNAI
ncbi:MAG: DUF1648 domain-containing protein [Williamsia sp.]|nr:DUF1648 domain-containing protein [Williamsia sp.]